MLEATSAVRAARSTGSKLACARPASMREKSRSALTSLSRRSPLRWAVSIGEISRSRRQHFLERPEHQGKWGAELVADVGEERRLRPVDLSQRICPAPLLFVSVDVGQTRGDLSSKQTDEVVVIPVQFPERIEGNDQHACRRLAALPRNRVQQRLAWRLMPITGRKRTYRGRQLLQRHRHTGVPDRRRGPWIVTAGQVDCCRRGRMPLPDPGGRGEASASVRAIEQVEQAERQVVPIGAEGILDPRLTSASVCAVESSDARRRSVPRRRAPMTRSVSSVTTHSMPATAPDSSRNGL